MTMTKIVRRSGSAENILLDLGFIIKETSKEMFVVFPDGLVVIDKNGGVQRCLEHLLMQ